MATKNRIKGITLEIGGDTSGLSKALGGIDSKSRDLQGELREVNKLLKLDPKNTELLSQKQKILAEQIETTSKRLEALKKAEKAAQVQFEKGEISERQYRALQREIISTERALKGLNEEGTKGTAKTSKSFDGLKNVLKGVAGGVTAFLAGMGLVANKLSELEENTREYREDLNRLDTAFKTSGKSVESARKAYSDFYAVLGEEDRSVEAVNHLAKLCNTEEELSKWSTICAGVSATFGDSLPIEGLTEASNETAKVGTVTGVLADALNWAGIKEDEFNLKLANCSTEQERSALITETLNSTYSDAAQTFNEANSSVTSMREATQKMTDAQAKMGEAIAPVKAKITSAMASITSSMADVIVKSTNLSSESDRLVKKLNTQNKTYKDLKKSQEEKTKASVSEIDYTKRLYDELKTLTDLNGKVTDSNKIRVSYILNELNEALGLELELTGEQIQGYKDICSNIDLMITKRRAEIILASQEEAYKTAIKEKTEIEKNYISLLTERQDKIETIQALQKNMETAEFVGDQNEMAKALMLTRIELAEIDRTIAESNKTMAGYSEIINDYESAYQGLVENNAEAIKKINSNVSESLLKQGEATEEQLRQQLIASEEYLKKVQDGIANNTGEFTQDQLNFAKDFNAKAKAEYEACGKTVADAFASGIEQGKSAPSRAIKDVATIIKTNLNEINSEEIGRNVIGGFVFGMQSKAPEVNAAVYSLVETTKKQFTKPSAFDVRSPSRWAKKIGVWVDEGLANGILEGIDTVKKSFAELFGTVEEQHEDLTQEEEKYQSELNRIQTEGTEETNKAYLEQLKNAAENAKKQRELIRSTFEGMVDDVNKSISELQSSIDNYGKSLSEVELTVEKTTKFSYLNGTEEVFTNTELADLSKKKEELTIFRDNIINLKEIGIDETMIEEIKRLGGEKGGILAQALLDATPQQREIFINYFKAIGELAAETSTELYQSEIEKTATQTKNIFEELNPDLLKVGQTWGQMLGNGVLEKLKETMNAAKTLVRNTDSISSGGRYVTTGGGGKTVNFSSNITQNITATPQTANDVAEAARRMTQALYKEANLS